MILLLMSVCYLNRLGGNNSLLSTERENSGQISIIPHARTLRNAREQVKLMVIDRFYAAQIKRYLNAWLTWWVRTSQSWHYQTVLAQFIHHCRDRYIAGIAMALLLTKDREIGTPVGLAAGLDFVATARGR